MSPPLPAISCTDLTVRVPGRTLVDALELDIEAGSFVAVLGKNGAGKSLTMHTFAGLRPPDEGSVVLGEDPIDSLKRRTVARRLALLPQDVEDVFPSTVFDTVMIGRHPHIGGFALESATDRQIALRCLRRVGLAELADRDIGTLSGGERRRVAIAQALTQDPAIYLLDEPTNHLDPQHQLDVLQVFADKARDGATVIANLHDVNLAVRFATTCLLLYGDGRWTSGDTRSVLDERRLSELYGTRMEAVRWRDREIFMAGGG
jgi:iron complex transport system ATP-binding protein